jgi:glycosyltransferase involved in cell wall biosynthesis
MPDTQKSARNAAMKLMFISTGPIAFTVETPEREPLGGTESCVAYLARHLATNGHDVTLMAILPPDTAGHVMGVRHLPLEAGTLAFFTAEDFDAVIATASLNIAKNLRGVAPRACHVAWLHMMPNQPAMDPLRAMAPYLDCVVFVSQTQRQIVGYPGPAVVIGNGIAPVFENQFSSAEELQAAKQNRGAYTSTPFRGLHYLPGVMGRLSTQTRFDVYSSMQLYRAPETDFASLYELLKKTPDLFYHGAVPQPALAEALKPVAFLAYPCIFAETFCIAALEAIAAGLKVVSIDLGALKETTLGYADLLPLTPEVMAGAIVAPYAALLEKNVTEFLDHPGEWAERRFAQAQTVVRACSWRARAREWEEFLGPMIAAKRG